MDESSNRNERMQLATLYNLNVVLTDERVCGYLVAGMLGSRFNSFSDVALGEPEQDANSALTELDKG